MSYVSTGIVVFAVSLMLGYIARAAMRKPEVQPDGSFTLRWPGAVAAVGYVAIAFGVVIGAVEKLHLVPTTGGEVVPYIVAFFALLGLPLVLLGHRTRITVTEQGIQSESVVGTVKTLRWSDVRRVSFSFTSEMVLHSAWTRIRLSTMLTGFDDFLAMMKRKLEPPLYDEALRRCVTALARMRGAGPGR